MVTGIIGKKVGMTQLFLDDGTLEPATVLQAGPCIVVQSKSAQSDGYDAVQLGLVESKPPRRANQADQYAVPHPSSPPSSPALKGSPPGTRSRRHASLAKASIAR